MTIKNLEQLNAQLAQHVSHVARGVILAFQDDTLFEQYWLPALIDGYGTSFNDLVISYPEEIAEMSSLPAAAYDSIAFEIVDDVETVPFATAWEIFDMASKHYINNHPDRSEAVQSKMRDARKTFDRLIARHEAWKKANKVV